MLILFNSVSLRKSHTHPVVCRVPYRCNSLRELAHTYMSLLWPSHKEFDVPSVQELHNRCSDEVFFSWLNALVQGSDQVI